MPVVAFSIIFLQQRRTTAQASKRVSHWPVQHCFSSLRPSARHGTASIPLHMPEIFVSGLLALNSLMIEEYASIRIVSAFTKEINTHLLTSAHDSGYCD